VDDLEVRLNDWMRRALTGDRQAYRHFLDALTPRLKAYFARRLGPARAADVEDLVQETLIAIHTRRETYDPTRPVTAWCHAIARYKLIDHLRREPRRAAVPIDEVDHLFATEDHAATEARMDVERVLSSVPERQQALIRSVRIAGAPVAEAASAAGMSETAAKVSIHRALRSLSARFAGKGDRVDE
jgi:RNA polymerase sigma-70 factor (ECF subfamily)